MSEQVKKSDNLISDKANDFLKEAGVETSMHRLQATQPQCDFGLQGTCCQICNMGPCQIDPTGDGAEKGICGADADTIGAWNLARKIAAGAASQSEYCRDTIKLLLKFAESADADFKIKDTEKLFALAKEYEIPTEGYKASKLAMEVAKTLHSEFSQGDGFLKLLERAPQKRQSMWKEFGVAPSGINSEIVRLIDVASIGGGDNFKNVITHGIRTALADGWGSSMIAADLSDVLFPIHSPIRSQINESAICKDAVNIIICCESPVIYEAISAAANDPELIKLSEEKGARGIRLASIWSGSNNVLTYGNLPVVGNTLTLELPVLTGMADTVVIDANCAMPALSELASQYHTNFITTSSKYRFRGDIYLPFDVDHPLESAKQIVRVAVENFPNRDKTRLKLLGSEIISNFVSGFTPENLYRVFGGTYRRTYKPLNNAIIEGRIRGVAAIIGCNNPKIGQDNAYINLVQELIKGDVLVVQIGCAAIECAKAGLLSPEGAQYAGEGLREVCEAVGIPPVLHMGSCADTSRVLTLLCNMISEGGVGEDLGDIPVAAALPSWVSEKAVSIGFYLVASGIFTILGMPLPILGSQGLSNYLCGGIEEELGGRFAFEADPIKGARIMIDHINKKREALKLQPVLHKVTV